VHNCGVVSVFVSFYLFFLVLFSCSLFFSLFASLLSDRFFICPVAEVAVVVDLAVVVMGLQDVQSQNVSKKKSFHNQIIMKNERGLRKRGAQLFQKRKKKRKIPSSTPFSLSSCQVFAPLRRRR